MRLQLHEQADYELLCRSRSLLVLPIVRLTRLFLWAFLMSWTLARLKVFHFFNVRSIESNLECLVPTAVDSAATVFVPSPLDILAMIQQEHSMNT
jgi:hypothetical protein